MGIGKLGAILECTNDDHYLPFVSFSFTFCFVADRCGGETTYAAVSDSSGKEIFRHEMPDEDDKANVEALKKEYPGAMPYFFPQDAD